VRLKELPMSPPRVLSALQGKAGNIEAQAAAAD
jgi:hypothetical protein